MQENKPISKYRLSLHDKILTTAIQLFSQRGIKAVKMDDIAQQLAISKRTLYEIYANKEVVLFECIKSYLARQERDLTLKMGDQTSVMDIILYVYKAKIEEFRATNPAFYNDLAIYPKVMEFLKHNKEAHHERFLQFMKRGVQEGYFRNDINYELVSMLLDAMGQRIMHEHLYNQYSIEQIYHSMIFVSLRGFCTSKGVRALDVLLANSQDKQ